MDDVTQNQSISEKVAAAVRNGQLKMRPKWHFILRASLWATGIAVVVLTLFYFSSLFIFVTWRTGIWVAPLFGWRGLFIFLTSIPWLLLFFTVIFMVILEILVRHYSFAWRRPLIFSIVIILFVVALGGLVLANTPLHGMLSHCPPRLDADHSTVGGPPPCGMGIYRDLDSHRFNNIHRGVIVDMASGSITIENNQQDRLIILVTPHTRLPFGSDFTVGDMIVVIGDRHGDQVEAFGISEVND